MIQQHYVRLANRWVFDAAFDEPDSGAAEALARRAVSTAYYAVFHAICASNADALAGPKADAPEQWTTVYRALQHGAAKHVCAEIVRRDGSSDMGHVAGIFVDLQEARHDADYNPSSQMPLVKAHSLVSLSGSAIERIGRFSEADRRAFAIALLFAQRR